MAMRAGNTLLSMPADHRFAAVTYIKLPTATMRTPRKISIKRDCSLYLNTIKTLTMSLRLVYLESPHEFQVTTIWINGDAKRFLRLLTLSKDSESFFANRCNIHFR